MSSIIYFSACVLNLIQNINKLLKTAKMETKIQKVPNNTQKKNHCHEPCSNLLRQAPPVMQGTLAKSKCLVQLNSSLR